VTTRESVIFDLDGTLIESEQIWADVREHFVTGHGGRWRDDAQKKMIGMSTTEWSRYVHDDLGVALPLRRIARDVIAAMVDRLSRDVPVLPGADAVLARLGAEFLLGLATSAPVALAQTVLAKTGWRRYFAVVVSSEEVARGKPAPDVYLRALDLLKADPARTAAIEDSTNGILSADAAKLAVIAVPNRAYPPDTNALARATRVVGSLDKVDVALIRAAILD